MSPEKAQARLNSFAIRPGEKVMVLATVTDENGRHPFLFTLGFSFTERQSFARKMKVFPGGDLREYLAHWGDHLPNGEWVLEEVKEVTVAKLDYHI